jgi:hypothetical protein
MRNGRARAYGRVVVFPAPEARPFRSAPRADEPCGTILLFTGVQYERPQPAPGPSRPFRPFATLGRKKRRRP